jgi:hypothetical protein
MFEVLATALGMVVGGGLERKSLPAEWGPDLVVPIAAWPDGMVLLRVLSSDWILTVLKNHIGWPETGISYLIPYQSGMLELDPNLLVYAMVNSGNEVTSMLHVRRAPDEQGETLLVNRFDRPIEPSNWSTQRRIVPVGKEERARWIWVLFDLLGIPFDLSSFASDWIAVRSLGLPVCLSRFDPSSYRDESGRSLKDMFDVDDWEYWWGGISSIQEALNADEPHSRRVFAEYDYSGGKPPADLGAWANGFSFRFLPGQMKRISASTLVPKDMLLHFYRGERGWVLTWRQTGFVSEVAPESDGLVKLLEEHFFVNPDRIDEWLDARIDPGVSLIPEDTDVFYVLLFGTPLALVDNSVLRAWVRDGASA